MIWYKTLRVNGEKKLLHRHIMERHINRELREDEHIHHIDEDILNNDIENLKIMTPSEHSKLHYDYPQKPTRMKNNLFFCYRCKKYLSKDSFHKNKNKYWGINNPCKECYKNLYQERMSRLGRQEP